MGRSVSADTSTTWQTLATMPLLAGLPDDRLRRLWSASVPRRHQAGEMLRRVGDPAEYLLLLLHGRVSATITTATGRVVRFGEWTAPSALDKIAVIDGRGHPSSLTAVTPCSVRYLPRDQFEELVDDVAAVRRHVLRLLAQQARQQQERFADTATRSVEARLAAWLLEQAEAAPDRRSSCRAPSRNSPTCWARHA